jgi:hypothetical protein
MRIRSISSSKNRNLGERLFSDKFASLLGAEDVVMESPYTSVQVTEHQIKPRKPYEIQ